ncbi:MAG: pentapeptide repeat-containing protein [Magnetospirillum sp. WYHS-4]
MPNIRHLQNIAQGAEKWNAWREREPDVVPDLAQADLEEAKLAGMNLGGVLMPLANLKRADLSGADCTLANLSGANLEEVNLGGAKMEGANMAGAYLLRANLSGTILRRANLSGAALVGKVNLTGADMYGAVLSGARLSGALLSGANLANSILAGADLREADLQGANLAGAEISGAKFDGANLTATVLDRPSIQDRRAPPPPKALEPVRPPAPEVPVPEEPPSVDEYPVDEVPEDDRAYFTYETRDAAILLFHVVGFARRTPKEKQEFLGLLRRYDTNVRHVEGAAAEALAGDVIVMTFQNSVAALIHATNYLTVLGKLGVHSYAGVNWGEITVRRDMDTDNVELILNSIAPNARLDPIGQRGEVLVLEELHSRLLAEGAPFEFVKVQRAWKLMGDDKGTEVDAVCYQVLPTRSLDAGQAPGV